MTNVIKALDARWKLLHLSQGVGGGMGLIWILHGRREKGGQWETESQRSISGRFHGISVGVAGRLILQRIGAGFAWRLLQIEVLIDQLLIK